MEDFDQESSVDMIAAALRADANDLSTLAVVLSKKLTDILPAGHVTTSYSRSLSDRVAKRDGHLSALKVLLDNISMDLTQDRPGQMSCMISQVVRGVVISRKEVQLSDWLQVLAQGLKEAAASSAQARAALQNLLN